MIHDRYPTVITVQLVEEARSRVAELSRSMQRIWLSIQQPSSRAQPTWMRRNVCIWA